MGERSSITKGGRKTGPFQWGSTETPLYPQGLVLTSIVRDIEQEDKAIENIFCFLTLTHDKILKSWHLGGWGGGGGSGYDLSL